MIDAHVECCKKAGEIDKREVGGDFEWEGETVKSSSRDDEN
jgi:hypothetical protein